MSAKVIRGMRRAAKRSPTADICERPNKPDEKIPEATTSYENPERTPEADPNIDKCFHRWLRKSQTMAARLVQQNLRLRNRLRVNRWLTSRTRRPCFFTV